MSLISIGFLLSKCTVEPFTVEPFLSLFQVVGISLSGCILSIILFLVGINVVIECTLASLAHKFVSAGNVALPLVRAFMDDLNLMPSTVSGE